MMSAPGGHLRRPAQPHPPVVVRLNWLSIGRPAKHARVAALERWAA